MKKILILSFIIGLVIGIVQLFWTYSLTFQNIEKINVSEGATCLAISPECGVCVHEIRDGKCYEPKYTKNHRGFPFRSAAYGYDSRIDTSAGLYVNIAIWAVGLPSLSYAAVKAYRKIKH